MGREKLTSCRLFIPLGRSRVDDKTSGGGCYQHKEEGEKKKRKGRERDIKEKRCTGKLLAQLSRV